MTLPTVFIFKAAVTYIGVSHNTRIPKLAFNRRRRELRVLEWFMDCVAETLQVITTAPDGEVPAIGRIQWLPTAPDEFRDWNRATWQGGPRDSERFSWPLTRECAIEVAIVHTLTPADQVVNRTFEVIDLLYETLGPLNGPHGPECVNSGFAFNRGLRSPRLRIRECSLRKSPMPTQELFLWIDRHEEQLRIVAPGLLPPMPKQTLKLMIEVLSEERKPA